MNISQLMTRDFDLADAEWPISRLQQSLSSTEAAWVLIRDRDEAADSSKFFAIHRDALALWYDPSRGPTVRDALGLGGAKSAPLLELDGPARSIGTAQVVIDELGPVGVIPPTRASRGLRDLGGSAATGAPPAGADEATAEASLLTRHLVVDLAHHVRAGEKTSLVVALSAVDPLSPAAAPLAKPAGTKVDVVVKPLKGFDAPTRTSGMLLVSEPQLEEALHFELRAQGPGPGVVRVYAFCEGASVGAVTVNTIIADAGAIVEPAGGDRQGATLAMAPRPAPDLSVFIFENGSELSFRLSSADGRYHMSSFPPVKLRSEPSAYFASFFADIEGLPLGSATERRVANERLTVKGATLFESVLPSELRVLLWSLRERIKTIQITSEEPWIPWEVCRLTGEQDGRIEEGPFFAEAFNVTRWLPGASIAASLRMNNVALVVPPDSDLAYASLERDFMRSLRSPVRDVTEVTPRYLDVRNAMAKGAYDAWHFCGHAAGNLSGDANASIVHLAAGDSLRPEDIVGNAENLLLQRPLVFLNGCQSAQAGFSLAGAGGWARRFLSARTPGRAASAFVGSYWSVHDAAAFGFAKEFYEALLSGSTVAEAGRTARLAIRAQEDPTWLAHTIYADPFAKLETNGEPP